MNQIEPKKVVPVATARKFLLVILSKISAILALLGYYVKRIKGEVS